MAGGAIAPVVTGLTAAEMFYISTAVSALGALGSVAGQMEAQKRGKEYAQAQAEAARVATINSYDQLQLQRQQELENASQRITDTALEGAKARAKAATAAGEAGISGLSVDALLADFQRQQSGFTETVKTNFSRKSAQIEATMEGVRAGAQSTINQIPEPKAPDYLGAAVRAGTETWGAYRDWDRDARGKLKIQA
ncbi:virion core protein, T7 gp14 family [Azospirillum sp.]|uniref:virion core protein, T7 gp14 family n=1 Tax=Azospirillum sp. TaxID=34012 RepID=UPI003D704C49